MIGLKTVKGTKQLKLDPTIYDSLQASVPGFGSVPDCGPRKVRSGWGCLAQHAATTSRIWGTIACTLQPVELGI